MSRTLGERLGVYSHSHWTRVRGAAGVEISYTDEASIGYIIRLKIVRLEFTSQFRRDEYCFVGGS